MVDDFRARVFRRLGILVCTTVYCCVLLPSTFAGELGKARFSDKPIEVLGGRLLVRMPQGARIEARPFPIMSAPESEEDETRVVFDAGPERLVLMAHEALAFAGDDFEKDVRDWVARWKGKYRIEATQLPTNGLETVSVIPLNSPDHSRSDDATFVEGVFIESADRTIQSLDLYLNAAAEKDMDGCKTVARQILLSVAPGKKKLKLAAGERRLSGISEDLEISIMVPKNLVATRQDGPDFLVHRLVILGRLGAETGSIGIYVGNHPSFDAGTKKSNGMILGRKVGWQSFQPGGGLQVLCELPFAGPLPLFAHVWVQAPDDTQLAALKQAAESIKLVKARKPASNR